jgi:hypothetical protein
MPASNLRPTSHRLAMCDLVVYCAHALPIQDTCLDFSVSPQLDVVAVGDLLTGVQGLAPGGPPRGASQLRARHANHALINMQPASEATFQCVCSRCAPGAKQRRLGCRVVAGAEQNGGGLPPAPAQEQLPPPGSMVGRPGAESSNDREGSADAQMLKLRLLSQCAGAPQPLCCAWQHCAHTTHRATWPQIHRCQAATCLPRWADDHLRKHSVHTAVKSGDSACRHRSRHINKSGKKTPD